MLLVMVVAEVDVGCTMEQELQRITVTNNNNNNNNNNSSLNEKSSSPLLQQYMLVSIASQQRRKRQRRSSLSHSDYDSYHSCCSKPPPPQQQQQHNPNYHSTYSTTVITSPARIRLQPPNRKTRTIHRMPEFPRTSIFFLSFLLLLSLFINELRWFSLTLPVSAWVIFRKSSSLLLPPPQLLQLPHDGMIHPPHWLRHHIDVQVNGGITQIFRHGTTGSTGTPSRCHSALYSSSSSNNNNKNSNQNNNNNNNNGEQNRTNKNLINNITLPKNSTIGTNTYTSSTTKKGMYTSSSSAPQQQSGKSRNNHRRDTIGHSNSTTGNSNSKSTNRKYSNNNISNNRSGKGNNTSSTTTTTTLTSKQDLVRAVGESIKATRQKQQKQQQQQRTKQISVDTTRDVASMTDGNTSDGVATTKPSSLLNQLLNPYEAGQKFRQSIETTITSIQTQTDPTKKALLQQSQYYIDDRFLERGTVPTTTSSTSLYSTGNKKRAALLPWEEPETAFVPEILVVGATGRLGRLIVRQLLLQQPPPPQSSTNTRMSTGRNHPQQVPNVRVRVLVRDLYTRTLDILGTGVTYCQGDLLKIDTLEDAVTDVDKIVFVAAPSSTTTNTAESANEEEEQYQQRIKVAEQIDYIGMSNLISAYQNVRHADYGTSQAAKRSLFKFQDRNREDFFLFSIDDEDDTTVADTDLMRNADDAQTSETKPSTTIGESLNTPVDLTASYDSGEYDTYVDNNGNMMNTEEYVDNYSKDEEMYDGRYDEYTENEYEDNYDSYATSLNNIEKRNDASVVRTQSQWIRNSFDHGVFVGRIPCASTSGNSRNSFGGEAAIISSRLRSRDDPEMGIELGPNFAGFICRVCSDGNAYEAFVRTGLYATNGIEYVCSFTTSAKNQSTSAATTNASRNKFVSLRLPFSSFKPVQRKTIFNDDSDDSIVPPFRGYDVRHIGFRYRCSTSVGDNTFLNNGVSRIDRKTGIEWNRFYLAISYIKVYRSQPEPEFVFVSDARIPHTVHDYMIKHETKQLLPDSEVSLLALTNRRNGVGFNLLRNGAEIQLELPNRQTSTTNATSRLSMTPNLTSFNANRIPEETYYKYRGEELLKKSGLSYAIVRVVALCDSPASLDITNDIILSPLGSTSSIEKDTSIEKQRNVKSNEVPEVAISRADIAQICVQALLDPNALNKSFYVCHSGKSSTNRENLSTKFASLPTDS